MPVWGLYVTSERDFGMNKWFKSEGFLTSYTHAEKCFFLVTKVRMGRNMDQMTPIFHFQVHELKTVKRRA